MIGPDRIQVVKRESSAGGGDGAEDFDYLKTLDPQEDVLEAAGLYVQDAGARDETVYIERDAGQLRFRDQVQTTPLTLTQLLGGVATDPDLTVSFLLMGG
jgi:hypothetical protein